VQTKVIYKYPLKEAGTGRIQTVELPVGAKILCVQAQGDVPTVWAEVLTVETKTETRLFQMQGTGWSFSDYGHHEYIGTVQIDGYVWHFYEIKQGVI
jgi:hypothetical protein